MGEEKRRAMKGEGKANLVLEKGDSWFGRRGGGQLVERRRAALGVNSRRLGGRWRQRWWKRVES